MLRQRWADFRDRYNVDGNNTANYVTTLADALGLVTRPRDAVVALDVATDGFALLRHTQVAERTVVHGEIALVNLANLVRVRLACGFDRADDGAQLVDGFLAYLNLRAVELTVGNRL
jgi:hypothetical protein